MSHARLAPSAASRWMPCPGSVDLIASLPEDQQDQPNEHSLRGTQAHDALAKCLLHSQVPMSFMGTPIKGSTEGAVLGTEDIGAIIEAHNYILGRIGSLHDGMMETRVFVEHEVFPGKSFHSCPVEPVAWPLAQPPEGDDAPFLVPREDCKGTADCIIIGGGVLEVIDYKHGVGFVDEVENTQMLLYALGALRECMPGQAQTIRLTIIQPRCFRDDIEHIRSWDVADFELMAWAVKFNNAAVLTDSGAPLTPGDVQCKWCPAKAICPAISQQAVAAATLAGLPGTTVPGLTPTGPAPTPASTDAVIRGLLTPVEQLGVTQLSNIMDNESLFRAWLDAVRAHVTGLIRDGTPVPGWKIVAGRRSKQFTMAEDKMLKKLGNVTRLDKSGKLKRTEYTETKLISPAQMEKRIKPLVTEAVWKNLAATIAFTEGKATLAPDSDPRKPIKPSAEEMFNDVTDKEFFE